MKSTISIDTENSGMMGKIVGQSLESTQKVNYRIESSDKFEVTIETHSLGVLRGCSDTVYRLTMLADKIYTKR